MREIKRTVFGFGLAAVGSYILIANATNMTPTLAAVGGGLVLVGGVFVSQNTMTDLFNSAKEGLREWRK